MRVIARTGATPSRRALTLREDPRAEVLSMHCMWRESLACVYQATYGFKGYAGVGGGMLFVTVFKVAGALGALGPDTGRSIGSLTLSSCSISIASFKSRCSRVAGALHRETRPASDPAPRQMHGRGLAGNLALVTMLDGVTGLPIILCDRDETHWPMVVPYIAASAGGRPSARCLLNSHTCAPDMCVVCRVCVRVCVRVCACVCALLQ